MWWKVREVHGLIKSSKSQTRSYWFVLQLYSVLHEHIGNLAGIVSNNSISMALGVRYTNPIHLSDRIDEANPKN